MKELSKVQDTKLNSFSTTSAKIRFLNAVGFTRGETAKKLNKRYQHVRNVLEMTVKQPKEKI